MGVPYKNVNKIKRGCELTRTVEFPSVLPKSFDVSKGSERFARGIGEMLRKPTPPPESTDVEIGSSYAFANELPI